MRRALTSATVLAAPLLSGVLPRLVVALAVAGLLWLAVLWALA